MEPAMARRRAPIAGCGSGGSGGGAASGRLSAPVAPCLAGASLRAVSGGDMATRGQSAAVGGSGGGAAGGRLSAPDRPMPGWGAFMSSVAVTWRQGGCRRQSAAAAVSAAAAEATASNRGLVSPDEAPGASSRVVGWRYAAPRCTGRPLLPPRCRRWGRLVVAAVAAEAVAQQQRGVVGAGPGPRPAHERGVPAESAEAAAAAAVARRRGCRGGRRGRLGLVF